MRDIKQGPLHLSFSQLTMLHPNYKYSCPRKWGYRYKLGLAEERSPALAVGTAMDDAANAFFSMRRDDGLEHLTAGAKAAEVGIASLQQEPPEVWLGVKGDDPLLSYEALFMQAFAAFLNSEGRAEAALIQDKHSFSLQLKKRVVEVLGYSDRIDADGTIVDHKYSGSPRWDSDGNWQQDYLEEKRDQLLVYWLARAAEERRREAPLQPPLNGTARLVVTYHRLGMQKAQVEVKQIKLNLDELRDSLLVRLAEAAEIIAEGRLPLRPGLACRFCSFLGACRDDQAARGTPFMEAVAVPF